MDRPDTPEALFHAALLALRAEDWLAVTRLCDADSLEAFADELRGAYTVSGNPGLTAEDVMWGQPDMPREVAEYHAAHMRYHTDPERQFLADFPSLRSLDELMQLPADQVVAAWLQRRSIRPQVEAQVSAGVITEEAAQELLDRIGDMYAYEALGAVSDGPNVAHVIYRPTLPDDAVVQGSDGAGADAFTVDTAGRLDVHAVRAGRPRMEAGASSPATGC